jgi:peroxiredoxin
LVGLRSLALAYGNDVRILGISLDRPQQSRELAEKIAGDGRGALGISLLFDPRGATVARYGIRDPEYAGKELDGVPRPSVFVLDQRGIVRWSKIETDYRERPSIEEISAALDAFE